MSALTDTREVKRKDGGYQNYKLGAAKKVYKGAMVVNAQAGATNGYLEPLTDAAQKSFAGVSVDTSDNSAGSSGAKEARVFKSGVFEFAKASAVQTDVGRKCYGLDDQTVGLTTTNSILVGVIEEIIDSATVAVRIDTAVQ
jgi:predicted RecA/RadA family phage recombinase